MTRSLAVLLSLIIAAPAAVYVIVDVDGKDAHWPGEQLPSPIRVDPLGSTGSDGPQCLAAVQAALDTWTAVQGSYAGFVYSGDPNPDMARGTVVFARDSVPSEMRGALAVTLLSFNRSNGRILSAELIVDAKHHRWSTTGGNPNAYDVQSVVVHELGHYLGLDHTPDNNATMYHLVGVGETKKRTLAEDDLAGIRYLYPDASGDNGSPCTVDMDCDGETICADNRFGQRVCGRSCKRTSTRDLCLIGAECIEQATGAACLGGSDACRRCGADSECMAGICVVPVDDRAYCSGPCDPDRDESCPGGSVCWPDEEYAWLCRPTDSLCSDAPALPPLLRIAAGPNSPAAASVPAGTEGVVVLQLRMQNRSASETMTVSEIYPRLLSTRGLDSSVLKAMLYLDVNSDGAAGPGDELLGASDRPGSMGGANFGGIDRTLSAGQHEDWLLVIDLEPTAEQAGLPAIALLLLLGLVRRRRVAVVAALMVALVLLLGPACGKDDKPVPVLEYLTFQVDAAEDVGLDVTGGAAAEIGGLPLSSETLTVLLR